MKKSIYTISYDQLCRWNTLFLLAALWFLTPAWAAKEAAPVVEPLARNLDALMAEENRSAAKKVVVLPGAALANSTVTGTYQEATLDGGGGGVSVGGGPQVVRDVYGVPVGMSFPIFSISTGGGGNSDGVSRKVQEKRDALAKQLAEAASAPLSNDALATDVFWRLRDDKTLEPKIFAADIPIPEATDAILYVRYSDSIIDVQGEFAFLTTSATAALSRKSDNTLLYETVIHYRDRDLLENWTRNNSEAWHVFSAYSRHYLAREIAAELYERVKLQSDLRPRATATVSPIENNDWNAVSSTTTPTFAWNLNLEGDELQPAWVDDLGAADVTYEFEIYDKHQIVYGAKDIRESEFKVDVELEACRNYRWSVRPSYRVNGERRYGEWMRWDPDPANGNDGKAASVAAAYIYDFASLEVKCGSKRG